MKLALFTDTFVPQVNGVARTLKRLVNHLDKRQIDYQLFVPDSIEKTDLFASNIQTFTSLPFFLYPECRMALPNVFKIRRNLELFEPDLIHITTPFNIGLSGLHYGKKHNIPMVGSYHTHFDHYLRYYKLTFMSEMLWKYLRWFYSGFEKTFVPSVETKNHLHLRGFSSIDIWSRGVDCSLYDPAKRKENDSLSATSSTYTLLYVGRMAPEKDLNTLCQVMKQLPQALREQIHWIFVGDGPMLPELKEEFQTANVTFTGYLQGEALASVYAKADLFVFPSVTETFGNVVLEALASGTPAIVANKGGVKEIVQHGKTGMVCEAGQAESFVNAISQVLSQRTIRNQMGYDARAYAKTQSWDVIFDGLLQQYERAIFDKNKQRLA